MVGGTTSTSRAVSRQPGCELHLFPRQKHNRATSARQRRGLRPHKAATAPGRVAHVNAERGHPERGHPERGQTAVARRCLCRGRAGRARWRRCRCRCPSPAVARPARSGPAVPAPPAHLHLCSRKMQHSQRARAARGRRPAMAIYSK